MGLLNWILTVAAILMVLTAFVMAPMECINFVVKVGTQAAKLVVVAFQEGKPIVDKIIERMDKNETG